MKQVWTMLLLAGAVRAADLTVYQSGYDMVDHAVRHAAMAQASTIYSRIGVRVRWEGKRPAGAVDGGFVAVRYTMGDPGHPGAMAFAKPFDPEMVITVMYDRILKEVPPNPSARAALLAHVLAHEIGHALIRTDAHSADGIMNAHWEGEDYSRMVFRPLEFLPADAMVIRRELAGRSAQARLTLTDFWQSIKKGVPPKRVASAVR